MLLRDVSLQFSFRLEDDELAFFALGVCAREVLGSEVLGELRVILKVCKGIWVLPLAYVAPKVRSLHVRVELVRAVEMLVAEFAHGMATEAAHALGSVHFHVAVSHMSRQLLFRVEFLLDDEHLFMLEAEVAHMEAVYGSQMVFESAYVAESRLARRWTHATAHAAEFPARANCESRTHTGVQKISTSTASVDIVESTDG